MVRRLFRDRNRLEVGVSLENSLHARAVQDLVSAVGDIDRAQSVPCVDQSDFVRQSHRAVRLHGLIHSLVADLNGVRFRHAELLDGRLPTIEQHADIEPHEVCCVDLGGAIGQREGHTLVFGDRLAECFARLAVLQSELD